LPVLFSPCAATVNPTPRPGRSGGAIGPSSKRDGAGGGASFSAQVVAAMYACAHRSMVGGGAAAGAASEAGRRSFLRWARPGYSRGAMWKPGLVGVTSTLILACASGSPQTPAGPEPQAADRPGAEIEAAPVATEAAAAQATAPSATASAGVAPAPAPPAPLPAGLKILVIGDSFAEALGVGLKSQEKDRGIKVFLRGEKATFIPEWAGPNRGVELLVKQTTPDLVVIALGGNELAMTTPEIRAPKVAKLVGLLGSTPCVWVAPPLWGNKDNGLLGVIRDNSRPCRHFDSNVLSPDLPRGSDKIHPTAEGQKKWANHLLDWLQAERDATAPAFVLRPRPASE